MNKKQLKKRIDTIYNTLYDLFKGDENTMMLIYELVEKELELEELCNK